MIFLHINSKDGNIEELNKFLEQGKQIFILFYMEGCGPCNATRPEWKKIENILKSKYNNQPNIVVADVDQELLSKIPLLKKQPSGFPTMYYISDKGTLVEDYEESNISKKDRSIDSFIDWIESKISKKGGAKSKTIKNKKKYNKKGGKWSLKYKKSINCSRPKGFSQKNYCKYGRKRKSN
jgi:thiol-disulfide isomerase/thioredoxin